MSKRTHLLTCSLMGAFALLGCSDSKGSGGTASSGTAGAGTAGSAGAAVTASGGVAGVAGGSETSVGGLSINVDASTGEEASTQCAHLNIGILGNPGANASSNFQLWLENSGTSVQRIQTTADEPITAATLKPFDVLILDWMTRDYTSDEAAIFAAWVSAGGGVASMTGYNNDTTNDWHANSLLAPLAVAYSGPLVSGPIIDFAAHPITSGLTSVTFDGGYAISDLGGTASVRTPIAFLPSTANKTVVGYAVNMGAGHAFVWGDEWIEFDSEWSTLPQIVQLWVQVFAWIAPMNTCALTPPK